MRQHSNEWSQLERGARHRLVAIGVPHYSINPLVDLVFKWVSSNGPEWTVSRIKSLKIDLIRRKAGLKSELQWVRKNRTGFPSGVFGSLMRWCLESKSDSGSRKRFNSVLQALNISSLFTHEVVTESQLTKFLGGVNCMEPDRLSVEFLYNYSHHVMGLIPYQQVKRGGNSLLEYQGSPVKWAPLFHEKTRTRQSDNVFAEMQYASGPENYTFAWTYNELYAPVVRGIRGPQIRLNINPDKHLYGGEVHFLQEPGLKLRAIASPYRIHQLALKPIGDAIYDTVKRYCNWDCTFDQSKAMPWIQKSLAERKTVHSIDLTGATDYFPLGIQLVTLRAVFGDILDIKLIEEISRLRWKSEAGDIQWQRGQPLGLYPSFGMFTLTHGILLHYLLSKQGVKYDHQFFVVGDDVIILDDTLYNDYIDFLDLTHCPWSPSKSISSSLLAEFAGKIVLEDQVIASYKWRKMSNDNFLDICKNLGPKSAVLLTKAQKRVFDNVKHLLEPIGLNMSYPGSNLTKMVVETDRFLSMCESHVLRSLVDLTRVVHKNSYGSSTPYALDHEVVDEVRKTLDERVFNVFKQTVFHRCRAMWHAVAEIPQALGLLPRLPVEAGTPSRVSTLLRYQRLVGYKK
jgi:hypothetical protein